MAKKEDLKLDLEEALRVELKELNRKLDLVSRFVQEQDNLTTAERMFCGIPVDMSPKNQTDCAFAEGVSYAYGMRRLEIEERLGMTRSTVAKPQDPSERYRPSSIATKVIKLSAGHFGDIIADAQNMDKVAQHTDEILYKAKLMTSTNGHLIGRNFFELLDKAFKAVHEMWESVYNFNDVLDVCATPEFGDKLVLRERVAISFEDNRPPIVEFVDYIPDLGINWLDVLRDYYSGMDSVILKSSSQILSEGTKTLCTVAQLPSQYHLEDAT